MAEDLGERSEQPTGRRLVEARRKGQVARSQNLSAFVGVAAGVLLLYVFGGRMLEAGGHWDNTSSQYSAMLKMPYDSPRRGASTTDRPFGEWDANIGGWQIPGEPYTKAEGTKFDWWRARMLGGRTNHWGRISLRFGPDDFRRKSIDGMGDDWPIGYDDVKPWYDEVDRLIGIDDPIRHVGPRLAQRTDRPAHHAFHQRGQLQDRPVEPTHFSLNIVHDRTHWSPVIVMPNRRPGPGQPRCGAGLRGEQHAQNYFPV